MSIGPRTSAAANVIAGWLGRSVPPIPKQRNRTRASYRKTTRTRIRLDGVAELIRSLEEAGCQPRPAGPGQWFALCPTCRAAVVEIREVDGSAIVACTGAHEGAAAA